MVLSFILNICLTVFSCKCKHCFSPHTQRLMQKHQVHNRHTWSEVASCNTEPVTQRLVLSSLTVLPTTPHLKGSIPPQVYSEVRACTHCTACLNGDAQHVAPPTPTLAICPGPHRRPTHTNTLGSTWSAQMCHQNIPMPVHICQHSIQTP